MPIFTQSLRKVDFTNPTEAMRDMANHIRYIQEQLEYTLMNLDSSNIISIDTDDTELSGSSIAAISDLTRVVNGLASTVSVQAGNITNLQGAVNSLSSTVSNQETAISSLNQTVASHGSAIDGKLTATKVAAQAGVAADADAAALAAAVNNLIAAMKSSGVMNT